MLLALLNLTDAIISAYSITLLALVVFHWLLAFGIISPFNPIIRQPLLGLSALHEPILTPIRQLQYRLIPNMGGFDLSPVVALLMAEYVVRPTVRSILITALA